MQTFSFLPFQALQSDRLLLRQLNPNDAAQVLALRSNPETMQYIPRPLLTTIEGALEHINMIQDKIDRNEGINWAISLKGDPTCVGIIGHYRIRWEHFRSEIGYMLLPEQQGKGIITEAIGLVVNYGFHTMNMHSLEAIIDPANTASARVLEKNGFVKEAHLTENEYFDGKFLDSVIYSLIKK